MNEHALPGEELQPQEIRCPSCGSFLGTATRCPRCGAAAGKHISVRFFRWAAVVLTVGGLGLLYLMTVKREIPTVRIADVKPTMNFAYIRVTGTVVSETRIFREGNQVRSLRFTIGDGDAELPVTAYRAQAQELVDARRVPHKGDRVSVAGALAITGGKDVLMRIQSPEHVQIEQGAMRALGPVLPIAEVTPELKDKYCTVVGAVRSVRAPRAGSKAPWNVVIRDNTGEGVLVFWDDLAAELKSKKLLENGSTVRANVLVDTYRNKVQLKLTSPEDVETVAAPGGASAPAATGKGGARFVKIADLNAAMTSQWVTVRGSVGASGAFKKGAYFDLVDGTDTVRVVLWDSEIPAAQRPAHKTGDVVTVNGRVDAYEGRVELIPVKAEAIKPARTGDEG